MRIWCVGNALMGDDAVGCKVAELLLEKKIPDVFDCGVTPENYIAPLRRNPPSRLLIVDAADMGLPPGSVRRFSMEDMNGNITPVSHGVPLTLLLAPFSGAFEITMLGIQPASARTGAALSEPVERAARYVAGLIERGEPEKIQKL